MHRDAHAGVQRGALRLVREDHVGVVHLEERCDVAKHERVHIDETNARLSGMLFGGAAPGVNLARNAQEEVLRKIELGPLEVVAWKRGAQRIDERRGNVLPVHRSACAGMTARDRVQMREQHAHVLRAITRDDESHGLIGFHAAVSGESMRQIIASAQTSRQVPWMALACSPREIGTP